MYQVCGGMSRQTSPYSLRAECAAGCPRASQVREEVEGVREEVREVKGEKKGRRESLTS